MERDPRYIAVKLLLEKNRIRKLVAIFKYIPKTVVCTDLQIAPKRFRNLLKDPSLFSVKDIDDLAELIGVNAKILIALTYKEAKNN